MPKLSRMRMVSIGHADARMDDLLIPLRSEDGRASDTMLWLRNGGGKSSIGTLFFATLLPGRRNFLGAKADQKVRRLEDYVAADDRALVILEWELDGALDGEVRHFLTGVFYEWPHGQREEKKSPNALFFCTHALPQVPELTLDGLPIYVDETKKRQRVLRAFKERWNELRANYPHAQPRWTENLTDWTRMLREAGLDPDVFRYQIEMNRSEGGAEKLFEFTSAQQFVDLVLDMALDPEIADTAAQEILDFRAKLAYRADVLVPEQTLVDGLIDRLKAMLVVSRERSQNLLRLAQLKSQMQGLTLDIDRRRTLHEAKRTDAELRAGEASRAVERANAAAHAARETDLALERWLAERTLARLSEELAEATRAQAAAEYDHALWCGVRHLAEVRRHEQEIASYNEQIERFRQANAPLVERVNAAAREYAAALAHRIERLCADVDRLKRQGQEASGRARSLRGEAQTQRIERERALGEERSAKERLAQRRAAMDALREDGALEAGEAPERGVPRWTNTIAELSAEHEQRTRRAEEIVRGIEALAREQAEANESAQAADHAARHLERELATMRRRRSALEQDAALLGWLGVPALDFERAADSLPRDLRSVARARESRTVRFYLERAQHERAIDHLATHELLPPTRDVERVLEVLKGEVTAWSGWEYIAEASGGDPDVARQMVGRSSAIAAGVIVADTQIERAQALLAERTPTLEQPVLVVEVSTFAAPLAEPSGFVLGPTSAAYFDRRAGAAEELTRQQAMDELNAEIERAQAEREAIAAKATEVEQHQQAYPRGWTAAREQEIERERQRERMHREQAAQLGVDRARLAQEKATHDGRLHEIAGLNAAASGHLRALHRFLADHSEASAALEATATSALARAESCAATAAELDEQAEVLDAEAEGCAEQRLQLEGELLTTRNERERVREAVDVAPAAGDTHMLRVVYEQCRAELEGTLGENEARSMCARAEFQRDHAQQAFDTFLRESLPRSARGDLASSNELRQAMERALDSLGDPDEASEREHAAIRARTDTSAAKSGKAEQRKAAETACREVEDRCRTFGGVRALRPEETPSDTEAAERRRAEAAAALRKHEDDRREFEELASDARRESAEADAALGRLRGNTTTLSLLRDNNSDLLAMAPLAEHTWVACADEAEIEARTDLLNKEVQACRRQHVGLDERRGRAASVILRWLNDDRFQGMKSSVAHGLRGWDAPRFENMAEELTRQLTERAANLATEIADIDRDRVAIVARAVTAAMEAAKLVEALPRHSRLPETIRNIGGSDYLQIRLGVPADPAVQREMMANVVDRMVREGKIPRGIEFAKEALRHMAKSLEVRFLYPDPNVGKRWKPISELAKLSGGQRMTCAIVLYCAITRMRAHKRGHAVSPTGILFLDNPIGKASRRTYLDFQREVARAMGIQLIYMTGVNDYEALSALPVTVRFKNDRRDRRTGEALLEIDTSEVLELARLHREERASVVAEMGA